MKKLTSYILTSGLMLFLFACNNDSPQSSKVEENDKSDTLEQTQENKTVEEQKEKRKSENEQSKVEVKNKDEGVRLNTKDNTGKQNEQSKSDSFLNNLNAKEVEYARIWEQFGPLKNHNEGMYALYVNEIQKGSKVNPYAEDSAIYKENVVKLQAPMRAGGSITYSSNGDGTINIYKKVPYKWESPQAVDYSNMNEVTRNVIEENIETVYIEPTDNKTVYELANKLEFVE